MTPTLAKHPVFSFFLRVETRCATLYLRVLRHPDPSQCLPVLTRASSARHTGASADRFAGGESDPSVGRPPGPFCERHD